MKFSIIVPVYNAQKYITECCNSVFNQSYKNYELVMVDDGSTDGSSSICDQIKNSEPDKVKVIHTENNGTLLARRAGIREATGDVIVWLDADDYIHSELLQKLYDCFSESQCDLIFYNASKKADYSTRDYFFTFECSGGFCDVQKLECYKKMVYSDLPNSLCLKAAKRKCFDNLPDFSGMSNIINGEDLLLSLYMITAAEKISYLNETLYYYRQNEQSVVHSYNPDRAHSIKTVHQEFERFIDIWDMPLLHAAHYSREGRGWVETLLILMENKKHMTSSKFNENLRAMSEDEYFRCAYDAMDKTVLDRKNRILAKLLYQKQFFLLSVIGFFKSIKHMLKK